MANRNTTPDDFEAVLKEEAKRYNLGEKELRNAVREEFVALVAKQIAEKIVAGKVAPPPKKDGKLTW